MTICVDATDKGKSALVAGIHQADSTCRPQIVHREDNPAYYNLIDEFRKVTGVAALLNTSLNLHGHPIVSTYNDMEFVINNSPLDAVLTENYLAFKIS